MIPDTHKHVLVPLFMLHHVNPSTFAGFKEGDLAYFRRNYTPDELKAIVDALTWAEQHPELPYHTFLPNLPVTDDAVIFAFLKKVRAGLQPLVEPPAS